ncbi:tetratricopeptide repeat protein [Prosthecobacter vanneervenii]|uniref:Tetratricopeptide (TPR) repeat protein n=1 Tax=Prosthecobacter vanneervenii TaxID=48466 RepID=A0A7W7YGV6_9BACT|nr:tetratricopeptide repeat protein [Prosthecobacter vanneervenii]MBB5035625.1 tetratricopeptide (TPR) repeat protein [Prosthecobacter vanneervenii]
MKNNTPPSSQPPESSWKAGLWIGGLGAAVVALIAWALWPQKKYTQLPVAPVTISLAKAAPYAMPDEKTTFSQYAGSQSCRECHADQFAKWQGSHHGLAERKPDSKLDDPAFVPSRTFQHGTQTTETRKTGSDYELVALGFGDKITPYRVERVIGHDPLRQFLVSGGDGRLQAMEACLDPHKNEWFNVYGHEDRKPGEWGHWTGRGMVWNQMCATCHNTRLRKNYDAKTDGYRTTMAEMSVSCEACHGPMKAHNTWQHEHRGTKGDPTLTKWTRDQHIDNCAGCHARRGEITGDFVPGESFWDHYHLTITDQSDTFFPDGQIRDENYEFSSFLSSRMHNAGVRCMDCHDMHSMKIILPGNQLCMRCHTPGGFPNAPPIMPEAHSFHQTASTGNQCVNCHMPQTVYMQRHPRHDHGFTIPDPLLTKQFSIPNACNKCHTDKSTDWALEATQKWWGPKMDRRTRTRATLIAKARQGNDEAREGLVALLGSDEIPHWKASATLLLDRWIDQPSVQSAVLAQLQHTHPLVRESAVRTLEPMLQEGSVRKAIEPLLNDKVRGVRVTAAWALRESLHLDSAAGLDLQHMLNWNADQPSGQMQLAQFEHARRNVTSAIQHMETAIRWDPNSPPFHHDLALMYSSTGQTPLAIGKLRDAIKLAPNHAEYHYELGLALSESGDMPAVIHSLQEATRLDPGLSRAWYNLGLAKNSQGDIPGALEALQRGELANPRDPGIPYARATILAQHNRRPEAIAALDRALTIAPGYGEALQLRAALTGR